MTAGAFLLSFMITDPPICLAVLLFSLLGHLSVCSTCMLCMGRFFSFGNIVMVITSRLTVFLYPSQFMGPTGKPGLAASLPFHKLQGSFCSNLD